MKRPLILAFFLSKLFVLQGQSEIGDTIRLREVKVVEFQSSKNSSQIQSLDSLELQSPTYKDLGESLQQNANVFVKSYGSGSMATISLRGANASQTQVYWNGISLNSSLYGSTDLALFPTFFIDDAHVDYGLNSLKYGSGGLGGAVRMENKVQFKKRFRVNLIQDFGSFNQRNSALKIIGGNTKWQNETKLFYRTAKHNYSYKNLAKEGFPKENVENAHLDQNGFMQSISYRLKEQTWISGNYWYYYSNRNLPPLMTGTAFTEQQEDISHKGLLSFHHYFNESKLTVSAAIINDELHYTNERSRTESDNMTTSYQSIIDYQSTLLKILKWNSRLNTNHTHLKTQNSIEDKQREEISTFHQVSTKTINHWQAKVAFRQLSIPGKQHFWTPSFGLNYFIDSLENASVQLNLGQNVKYPSLNDLYQSPGGNAFLNEEKSNQISLSTVVKKKFKEEIDLQLSVSAFYADIEDYILWQPTAFGYWEARNIKAVETKGIEIRATIERAYEHLKLQLKSNYTYTSSLKKEKSYVNDQSLNKQLIYVPEHQLNSSLVIKWKTYILQAQNQFVGARYTTTDNSSFLPHYNLLDLTLSKEWMFKKQILQLSVSTLNLFDTSYQAIQWRPMPGRNYLLRLSLMLGS